MFSRNSVLPFPIRMRERLGWSRSNGEIKASSIFEIGQPKVPKCPNVHWVVGLTWTDSPPTFVTSKAHSTLLGAGNHSIGTCRPNKYGCRRSRQAGIDTHTRVAP